MSQRNDASRSLQHPTLPPQEVILPDRAAVYLHHPSTPFFYTCNPTDSTGYFAQFAAEQVPPSAIPCAVFLCQQPHPFLALGHYAQPRRISLETQGRFCQGNSPQLSVGKALKLA